MPKNKNPKGTVSEQMAEYVKLRRKKTQGVPICGLCGGVLFDIDGVMICGDCRDGKDD